MAQAAAAYIFKFVATNLVRLGASKAFIATIAGTARWAIQASLIMAASVAVNLATMPRQSVPDGRQPIRQPTPRRKSGFGRNRGTGAYINYAVDGGDSLDVLAIHDGRIAGIDQYYLHDDLVGLGTGPLGSGFVQGNPSTHLYYEAIYIDTRLGTATQTAFQRSVGRLPSNVWSSSHRALGVACIELLCLGPKAERLPKVYPLGLPRPSVVYRAQYCYDWRDPAQDINDWTTWTPGSRNPMLQLATYLINPAIPDPAAPDRCLGQGEDWDVAIAPRLAQWTQAADDGDAARATKGGGTEPAYQCDFEYFVGEDGADTIARILASCDGWLGEAGDGSLVPYVGVYREPDLTLENDWIIDWDIQSAMPDENRKNVLLPFWTDPDQKFARVEGARRYDTANIALVGKQRVQPVEFVQIQSHGQLQRILKRLMSRMTAPKRGTLVCDLNALQVLGRRWVKLPADFPLSSLQGAIIELDDINISLVQDRVSIPFTQVDPDMDDWDPDSEEGTAPPAPSEVAPQPVPVIDAGDVTATVATETLFGGDRAAVATLVFPSPINTFDLGASTVDVPRTELSWVVRWRPTAGGEWVEEPFEGDPISGDQENGYVVTLKTPALPRAALDVQVAAIGPQRGRGDWSDTIAIDVAAATAPALDPAQNVTAVASVETSPNGVRRPVLTVGFDPITDPQAQMVIIAVKTAGAAEATYSQIDMVEPRMGTRQTYNLPFGRTVDVGVQVWAKWRTPSAWVTVSNVAIADELTAADAVLPSLNLAEAAGMVEEGQTSLRDALAAARDRLDPTRASLESALGSYRDNVSSDLGRNVAAVAAALALTQGGLAAADDENRVRQTEIKSLSIQAAGFAGSITSLQSLVVDLEADKAEAVDLTALELLVGADDGQGNLFGRAAALEATAAALEADKAEVSTVDAINVRLTGAESDVADLQGEFDPGGRVTLVEAGVTNLDTVVADLEANKAEASTVSAIEARVSDVEGATADNAAAVISLSDVVAAADYAAGQQIDRVAAQLAGQVAEAMGGLSATIDGQLTAVRRVVALEISVGTDDGSGNLFGRIATSETAVADLEAGKVDVSTFTTLEGRVTSAEGAIGDLEGEFDPGGRVTIAEGAISTLNSVVTDLEADKVEVSTFSVLEGRVTTAEGALDDAGTAISENAASLSALSDVVVTNDASQARRVDQALAELAGLTAEALGGFSASVDEQRISATRINSLEVNVGLPDGGGTLFARVAGNESAVVDLEANKAEATALDLLEALVGTDDGQGALVGRIGASETAIADLETGKASVASVTGLSATVGDLSADVDVVAAAVVDIEGNLASSYGWEVDGNGVVANMVALSDGTTASIIFGGTVFQIWNGTAGVAPFEVSGGVVRANQLVVDWAKIENVVIAQADIGTAAVGTLQLEGGAVSVRPPSAETAEHAIWETPVNGASSYTHGAAGPRPCVSNDLTMSVDLEGGEPEGEVDLSVTYWLKAGGDMFEWMYWLHEIYRLPVGSSAPGVGSTTGLIYQVQQQMANGRGNAAVSASMVSDRRHHNLEVSFLVPDTLPGTGDGDYDADGYVYFFRWRVDKSIHPTETGGNSAGFEDLDSGTQNSYVGTHGFDPYTPLSLNQVKFAVDHQKR